MIFEATAALSSIAPNHSCRVDPQLAGLVLVTVDRDDAAVRDALCGMRSVLHIVRLTAILDLPQGPDALSQLCAQLDGTAASGSNRLLPDLTRVGQARASFRVCCDRIGTHAFRSVDVERVIGELIHERQGIPGRMKDADVIVRVDVLGNKVVIGEQIHHAELAKKRVHPEFIRDASLRPNVAFAMLHLSGYQPGQFLMDPFVGSGTILLEAAIRFGTRGRFVGMDRSERVVAGARANAASLGLADHVQLVCGNARALHLAARDAKGQVDAIVCNPPWGIRIGKQDDVDDLYRGFLNSAAEMLKTGGRAVVLVIRWESFLQHARCSGRWRVTEARPIRTGDMIPVLFVLERVDDTLWTGIKSGIHRLVVLCREGDGVVAPVASAESTDDAAVSLTRRADHDHDAHNAPEDPSSQRSHRRRVSQ